MNNEDKKTSSSSSSGAGVADTSSDSLSEVSDVSVGIEDSFTQRKGKPSLDMHRWTMRFKNKDAERRYTISILPYGTIRVEAFNFILFCYLFAEFFINSYNIKAEGILLKTWSTTGRSVYNIAWLSLSLSHVGIWVFMRLVHWKCISTTFPCENMLAAGVVVACLLFPFINRWRVVELFGSDRYASFPVPSDDGSASYVDDSITLSAVLAMLGYISLIIPIRFHVSVGLSSLFFVSLLWSTIVTGSPKENNYVYNFVVMGSFLIALILIKLDLDQSNRITFISDANAQKSAAEINKLLQLSHSRYKSPLSRLELAREKLITLGKCLTLDKSMGFAGEASAFTECTEQDLVKLRLINEVLDMISFPHSLLSRQNEMPMQMMNRRASASHDAIYQFMSENFYKAKDNTIDQLIQEDKKSEPYIDSQVKSDGMISNLGSDIQSRIYSQGSSNLGSDIYIDKDHLRKFCKDWHCNIVEIYRQLETRTMTTLLFPILSRLMKDCDDEVAAFLHGLSSRYIGNTYHHEAHACQVVHHGVLLAEMLSISSLSSNIEFLSFIVAAAAHDVGHFGRNNKFCISTKHEVALTYNDKSVLENMHASIAFYLLGNPNMRITKNFRENEYRLFRSLVIDLILATDMSENADAMSAFRMRVGSDGFDLKQENDRRTSYSMIIKASDIGHGSLSWEEHSVWSYWLCTEFFEQGDEERQLQLPISALCDRHNTDFAVCQQGFLRYCCLPMFQCFVAVSKVISNAKNSDDDTLDSKSVGFLHDGQKTYGICAFEQIMGTSKEGRKSSIVSSSVVRVPEAIVNEIEVNASLWKKQEIIKNQNKKSHDSVPDNTGNSSTLSAVATDV